MTTPPPDDHARVRAELATSSATAALWFGVLAGPLSILVHELASYAMVHWECSRNGELGLHVVTVAALAVAIAAGLIARRAWHAAGTEGSESAGGVVGRSRFMALGGMALSALSVLVILAMGYASLVLSPCQ